MVLQGQLRHHVVSPTEPMVRVSFSAGVCAFDGTESPDAMVRRADLALYEAKEAGRCRVVLGSAS
jgi:PleD family two-component response regulator